MADRLNPDDDLVAIGSITSQNGRSELIMQGDGNLVLYRGGKARWATNTNGKVVARAIMQGDGNFVLYGPGGAPIWATGTAQHPGAWLIIQDDGNVVIYDSGGKPLWATHTNVLHKAVAGFLPSTSGFHFSNSFDHVPDLKINILGKQIGIGDASNGLCGGMVFAARDYFESRISIPPDTDAPSSGRLFDYIVKRLFDSFDLILPPPPPPAPPFVFFTPTPPFGPGPVTYMWLMDPALPDHETVASNARFAPRGRAWIMIKEEWPKIRSDIDNGRLSPIGLVETKSLNPSDLGKNHQVLAYGYELDGVDLTIRIYDPNEENKDDVTLSLSIADPQHTTPVKHSAGATVWCFFRPAYSFSRVPNGVPDMLPNDALLEEVFDVQFYLNHNADLKTAFGTDYSAALDHWVNMGLPQEGRRGSTEFDVQFYLNHNADLKTAFGTDYSAALDHWVNMGLPQEGRRGSTEFDVQFYLNHYPDLKAAFGTNYSAALDHWLAYLPQEGRRGSAEFDVQFYLNNNADLKAAFGTDYTAALNHWLTYFRQEGRRGSPEFDVQFYLNSNADLKAVFGTNYTAALNHWLTMGLPKEGRRGSTEFDVQFYLNNNADLKAAFGTNYSAALEHWINHGISEGRTAVP